MNRTDEMLQITQGWLRLANATVIPAVRESCRDQRFKAMWELIHHRAALHGERMRSAGLKNR